MSYQQLTLEERYHIQVWSEARERQAEMARRLGRHPATVSRELRRNSVPGTPQPYQAARADRRTRQRRVTKGARARKIRGALRHLVEQKLRLSWSPEQISGRLRVELGLHLSHETIYQHVLRDARRHGFLRYCLRFGGYKHHRFKHSQLAVRTRGAKHWLAQRPAAANDRTELGHWERDCIVGAPGAAVLLTVIDRRSRYTRIRRVLRHTVAAGARATRAALAPYRHLTKTVTNDNGVEFQQAPHLEAALGVPVYFTDPSAPWQRGAVENANGLIRQYLPKRTRFDDLPAWTTAALEYTLNFRPRKVLAYRTPHESFYGEAARLLRGDSMHFGLEFTRRT
jgi:transposase, IS30 family